MACYYVCATGLMKACSGQNEPIPEDVFLDKWRATVGDTFQDVVDLKMLSVRGVF